MERLRSLVIIAVALFAVQIAPRAAPQGGPARPIIVIPGILGSKLCTRTDGNIVWGNRWSLANFTELVLPTKYDPATLRHISCGLVDTVNLLGPWQVHQYDDLLDTLIGIGYTKDVNLFVFDYDWRLSNRESARKLEQFIGKHVPTGQLDIVAHSMGGIIAKLWMAEQGGASRVGTLITLGTPHLGSATTFKTLDEGWGFWANLAAHGLGAVRETAMTFPSLYELLPAYDRCCGFRSQSSPQLDYFNPFSSSVWKRFRWMPTSFSSDDRQDWLRSTLIQAKAILQTEIPQGPRLITIVNSLIPTAWRVIFDPADGHVLTYLPQPGDGTVYQASAANNQLPEARPAMTSHQTIFSDDASRQVLRWVLTKGTEPTKGVLVNIKASLRTQTGAFVGITSASVEVSPSVLEPGQSGRLVVELVGQQELAAADLSNIKAFLDTVPPTALPSPKREVIDLDPNNNVQLRLSFPLSAPGEPGSFSVTVTLPSIADLSDVALVIPK